MMMGGRSALSIFLLVAMLCMVYVTPIICPVGHGQKGLSYSNGIKWIRDCPNTLYCWQVYTENIEQVRKLIDFPWDDYYHTYYINSCGGDYGMPLDYHPYRDGPAKLRTKRGIIMVNITAENIITGHGGTEQFHLEYICRDNYCSGVGRMVSTNMLLYSVIAAMASSGLVFLS
jgi:hypothetical protein